MEKGKKNAKPTSMVVIDSISDSTIRRKNIEIKFLEEENFNLKQRNKDLTKNMAINKEIIGALVDSI